VLCGVRRFGRGCGHTRPKHRQGRFFQSHVHSDDMPLDVSKKSNERAGLRARTVEEGSKRVGGAGRRGSSWICVEGVKRGMEKTGDVGGVLVAANDAPAIFKRAARLGLPRRAFAAARAEQQQQPQHQCVSVFAC
jgi:hypothetical protein